jgi:hypothetical protein
MCSVYFPKSEDEAGGHGNFVLYKDVKAHPFLDDVEMVASQTWMIGRTYAASPQRNLAFVKDKNPSMAYQKMLQRSGIKLGYFDFFHVFAFTVMSDSKTHLLNECLKRLRMRPMFSFDFDLASPSSSSTDFETIRLAIVCVRLFESLSFSSLQKIQCDPSLADIVRPKTYRAKNKRYQNPTHNLVFASKFIHFRVPAFVFISDSVTDDRLIKWKPDKGKPINLTQALRCLKIDLKNPYAIHYLKCYQLAKLLHEESKNSLPRGVDMILSEPCSTLPLFD